MCSGDRDWRAGQVSCYRDDDLKSRSGSHRHMKDHGVQVMSVAQFLATTLSRWHHRSRSGIHSSGSLAATITSESPAVALSADGQTSDAARSFGGARAALESHCGATRSRRSENLSSQEHRGEVALFRSLFEAATTSTQTLANPKTQTGYAPACTNEWCAAYMRQTSREVRRMSRQAFLPFTARSFSITCQSTRGWHVTPPPLRDCWSSRRFRQARLGRGCRRVLETCRTIGSRPRWNDPVLATAPRVFFFTAPSPQSSHAKWAATSSPKPWRGVPDQHGVL